MEMEMEMEMKPLDDPKPGDVVYALDDYHDVCKTKRLTKGKGYVVTEVDASGLWVRACDAGHNCCWGDDWRGNFAQQPTAPFTLLDDESRKALKAGDRVLVEAMLHEDVGFGGDGDVELRTQGSEFEMGAFVRVSGLFAILPPAKKPIAVGDFVSILGRTGSRGKVLAFASNGHAVVEYAAGDGLNVAAYDLSCLEVI